LQAPWGAAIPENAPVNLPAPANGIRQKGKARLACDHYQDAGRHWTGVLKILRLTDKNGALTDVDLSLGGPAGR
jgi:hypothetical protein